MVACTTGMFFDHRLLTSDTSSWQFCEKFYLPIGNNVYNVPNARTGQRFL